MTVIKLIQKDIYSNNMMIDNDHVTKNNNNNNNKDEHDNDWIHAGLTQFMYRKF